MSRMNAKTLLAIIIYEYKYESEKDVRVLGTGSEI